MDEQGSRDKARPDRERGLRRGRRQWASAALVVAAFCVIAPLRSAAKEPSETLQKLRETAQGLYREGKYADALTVAERSLEATAREFGPDSEETSIQSHGAGLTAERARNLPAAERHFANAVRIGEKVYGPDSPAVTEALARLGDAILRQGRANEAEPILARVLRLRAAAVGVEHSYTASAHAGMGEVALARGDREAALAAFRRAIHALTSAPPQQAVVRALADEDIRRNRDAFIGLARAAWAGRQTSATPAALLEESYRASQLAWATSAASALARMTARLKAGDTALGRRIRDMQAISDRILELHADDMRALAEWSKVQRADPTYSRLVDEFRAVSIAQSRVNAPVVEKQKELVARLQEQLRRCPPGQKPAGCDNADRERETISKELGALATQASKGAGSITSLSQQMQAAEAKLPGFRTFDATRKARLAEQQQLDQTLARSRQDVAKAFPEFISLTEPQPLAIAETQALLGSDEALVAILSGSTATFVWAVTRERADWIEVSVGASDIEATVAALRRGLDIDTPTAESKPGSGPTTIVGGFDLAAAHGLYDKLLKPLESVLAGKRHLLLVPTGPLTSLPFQVLLTAPPRQGATGPQALRSADWLVRRHALSVLPTVQSLSALRRLAAAGTATEPFLGIGDPILIGPSATTEQRGVRKRALPATATLYRGNGLANTRAVRELSPLPETADELGAIAARLGAPREALLLRDAATETRLKSLRLERFKVIDFATHGLVAGDLGVTEPALVLTPPDEPTDVDDGLLTASEVASLKLAAEWVILSACNTAAGNDTGADALSGLARAFFHAGARALLVSHWPVDSAATVRLTTGTFDALASDPRIGKADALRQATLALIDKGTDEQAHPSIWAPFVIVGEGGVRR